MVLRHLKKRVRSKRGFTLIELMIVVAIIGVLAAIAIPTYMDYTRRAKVSEALSLLGGIGTALAEFHASNGTFPGANATIGNYTTVNSSKYVENFSIDNLGDCELDPDCTDGECRVCIVATLNNTAIGFPTTTTRKIALGIIYNESKGSYDKCYAWLGLEDKYVPSSAKANRCI